MGGRLRFGINGRLHRNTHAIASRKNFHLDSDLSFQIIEQPCVGKVRIFQEYGANNFLIYLADDRQDAARWLEESRHINVRLEDVGADEICADHVEGRVA